MTQLGYVVLGLVLGAALGVVAFGTWRRSAASSASRRARLTVSAPSSPRSARRSASQAVRLASSAASSSRRRASRSA